MFKVKPSVNFCLNVFAVRTDLPVPAILSLVLASVLLMACQQKDAGGGWVAAPVRVESRRVEISDYVPQVALVGSLEAVHEVVVAAEVNGLVTDVAFQSGAWVEQGDILLSLNSEVEAAEVARYQAQFELSQKELARAIKLKDIGASQSRIDTLKKELDETAANIDWLKTILSKKLIRAPFSGRLGVSRVHLGQYLTSGEAIVTLTDDAQFYADFMLPERYLPQLQPGSTLGVSLQGRDIGAAQVIAIDPQLDQLSRATRVRALLPKAIADLHSGMFVRVLVRLKPKPASIMIPSEAVESTTFGDSVFVVDLSGDQPTAKRRTVTITDRPNDQVRVASGLQEGDMLVVSGQNRLRDGSVVELPASQVSLMQATKTLK